MHVSAQQLNRTFEAQLLGILFQILADCRTVEEIKTLFGDLLTETECLVLAKRVAVAMYLDKNRSYKNIHQALQVSSATIAQMQEKMGNPGIQLALQKLKAEEWAQGWSDRLGQVFGFKKHSV